jgi:hypothetical protein
MFASSQHIDNRIVNHNLSSHTKGVSCIYHRWQTKCSVFLLTLIWLKCSLSNNQLRSYHTKGTAH